jgi:nucleotide-binding universal stress UspA family protein
VSPLADALLSRSPIPTIVVWDGDEGRREAANGFRRVLVPVVSTVPSRAAQEVAFGLACANAAEVVIAHVDVERSAPVPVGGRSDSDDGEQRRTRVRQTVAQGVVYEAADLARKLGVDPQTIVRQHESRAEAISELAVELEADLVVLGSELQPVAGETFMGHLVERLIRAVHCSVAVVAMPRQALGMPEAEPYPS